MKAKTLAMVYIAILILGGVSTMALAYEPEPPKPAVRTVEQIVYVPTTEYVPMIEIVEVVEYLPELLPEYLETRLLFANGMDPVAAEMAEYFYDKGLNRAQIAGILGNIQAESAFKVGAHGKTGAGLAQWCGNRSIAMKEFVGSDWKSDNAGQIEFIWHELTNDYDYVLERLLEAEDTEKGARVATDIFLHMYERPPCDKWVGSMSCGHFVTRNRYAQELYKMMEEAVIYTGPVMEEE